MFKIISSEEYAKLTRDVDYQETRALEENRWRHQYLNKVIALEKSNQSLRLKIKELEKDKVTFVSFGEVKSLNKARKIAEEFRKTLNNEHNSL